MGVEPVWPTTAMSLLKRIRRPDDDEAWSEFVAIYSPLIVGFCRKRGFQTADAKDVAQEVMSVVFATIGDFDYDTAKGRFRGWLGTLTRHAAFKMIERIARRGEASNVSGMVESLQATSDAEWTDAINAHLLETAKSTVRAEFDEDTWVAFELVWHEDRKPVDVARQLGRKLTWVYKAKHRVLERLKAEVASMIDDVGFLSQSGS